MDTDRTPPPGRRPFLVRGDGPAAISFLTEASGFVQRPLVQGQDSREVVHAEEA